MSRRIVPAILGGLVLTVGLAAYAGYRLWDRCAAEPLLDRLTMTIPRDKDGDGFVIANIRLLPHQLFEWPYRCEADVTPIRGNVDLSWRHVQYEVSTVNGVQRIRLVP